MNAGDHNRRFHFLQNGNATRRAGAAPNNWFQVFTFGPQQRAFNLSRRIRHKIHGLLALERADHIFKSQIAFGLGIFLSRQHPRLGVIKKRVDLF